MTLNEEILNEIDSFLNTGESERNNQIGNLSNKIFEAFQTVELAEQENFWENLKKACGKDIYSQIMSRINGIVAIFSNLSPIRDQEELLNRFFCDEIFEQLQYNDSVPTEQYKEFGFTDERTFEKAYHGLTQFIISDATYCYSPKAAKQEFERITKIGEPYSSRIERYYEKYLQSYQLRAHLSNQNAIIDQINQLGQMITILANREKNKN